MQTVGTVTLGKAAGGICRRYIATVRERRKIMGICEENAMYIVTKVRGSDYFIEILRYSTGIIYG